ncbi:MAG: rhomboid family intramembrane serine protease [Isosphaeraceae bacterium]|nr:rhomboid family intramembrane serine protease [Isosphaeraceae bacterium]
MRHLGTLPNEGDARLLSDHLEGLGMTTRVEPEGDRWALWVYHEDHVPQARQEFAAFEKDPSNPRFRDAPVAAEAARREAERLERDYRKRVRDMKGRWDGVNYNGRPLTVTLIALCVLVFIGQNWPGWGEEVRDKLLLTRVMKDDRGIPRSQLLREVESGELWRLVTPIFLHFGVLHLAFNMWALLYFGTVIEYSRGSRTLFILVLLSAVASNMIQYAFMLSFYAFPMPFGGMSGVVYALFGYVWMKSRNQPEQGMFIHPRSVRSMLFWLVLCAALPMLPVANAAHFGGLLIGILFALARF